MLQNASKVMKPTLIIQGEADIIALPISVKLLPESLASKNKSLRTFAEADHYFYDAIFPKTSSKYDSTRRKQAISTVKDWLKAQ